MPPLSSPPLFCKVQFNSCSFHFRSVRNPEVGLYVLTLEGSPRSFPLPFIRVQKGRLFFPHPSSNQVFFFFEILFAKRCKLSPSRFSTQSLFGDRLFLLFLSFRTTILEPPFSLLFLSVLVSQPLVKRGLLLYLCFASLVLK